MGLASSALKPVLKRALPPTVWEWLRVAAGRPPLPPPPPPITPAPATNVYEAIYDAHAERFSDDDSVGGMFDLIGPIELGVLLAEGLEPSQTLLDFGCGTGRLAIQVIPRLAGGRYLGVDVSQSMLDRAERRIARLIPDPPCAVSWIKQTTPVFPFPDASVDMICAFSVFTHIEHEDAYGYLKEARRVVRPGGRFVFSCLPMNLEVARDIFVHSTNDDFHARWAKERNVTTSVELMETIARLAGWIPLRWYAGDEFNIPHPETGDLQALGQSTCVLEAPGPGVAAPALPRGPAARAPLAPEEIGRIELRWEGAATALAPHLTGPLEGTDRRFDLSPSGPPSTPGALAAPPFALLRFDQDRRRASVSLSRVVPGTYRYSVHLAAPPGIPGALAASRATVRIYHRESPQPIVLTVPDGTGERWTVFEVVVEGDRPTLRLLNTLDAVAEPPMDTPGPPSGAG